MGFKDIGITLAYSLSIIVSILCALFSFLNWNKGAEDTLDKEWHEDEKRIEEEMGEE